MAPVTCLQWIIMLEKQRRWENWFRSMYLYLQHTFNGPFSGTTRVIRYQKGKTNLDFTEARDSEWQWHRLGSMQVFTSLQTDNHTSTPPLKFLQATVLKLWDVPFLPPNQQHQSTEGYFNANKMIECSWSVVCEMMHSTTAWCQAVLTAR